MFRRYFGKRNRRRWARRVNTYKKAGSQLYKDVRYLKSLVNVEKKFRDLNQDINVTNTATVIPVSLMPQGDDWDQRNGRRVKAYSFWLQAQVTIDPSATKTNFRIVVFIDKNPDGESVTSAELFQVSNDLQSPLNKANAGSRFKILCNRFIDLSINGVETRTIKIWRKLNHHVNYLGTGETNGDMGPGNMYMYVISNEPTAAPLFHYYSRFSYIDN